MFKHKTLGLAGLFLICLLPVQAMAGSIYEVTITNLTKGQSFTPLVVATHNNRVSFFEAGSAASPELEAIAEGGDISGLMNQLALRSNDVMDMTATSGLLAPGASVTVTVEGDHIFNELSVVGMLIPTNDTIVGVSGTKLAPWKRLAVPAYDAGTEMNDELCVNIPGPVCGGVGVQAEGGEGYIYVSNGISGEGDLSASAYDWRNPVAHIEINRIAW